MCPNSQLLSAFIDRELPAKYEKQVRSHIKSCPKCLKQVEKLSEIQNVLQSSLQNDTIFSDTQLRLERNWRSIQKRLLSRRKPPLIMRNIRLPLPIAVLILFLCISTSIGITYTRMRPPMLNNNIAEIPSFDTMEELILFLDANQNLQTMEIKLPEEPLFLFFSKPTLIPEDEYKAVKW